ncbi:substrate-binding domain-containing protein [Bombiscardovia apis]|nr:substrate-binding domain-containing protein [Bombiscardovia apis]
MSISQGTHEQLYSQLTSGRIDLAFNDQRRALSGHFINEYLTSSQLVALLPKRALPQARETVSIADIAELPCILVASQDQRQDEIDYYRDALGLGSRYLFSESIEEAELMVAANKGYLLLDERGQGQVSQQAGRTLALRGGERKLARNYYAFWLQGNSDYYIEAFAQILKEQFAPDSSK